MHMPGKQCGKPDALSRRPDYDKGENDNYERTLLTGKHFRELAVEVETVCDGLLSKIQRSKKIEGKVRESVRKILEG